MKKWLVAILFGSALVLGACGGGGSSDGDGGGETSAAEAVYKKNCASCHGQDLSGGAGDDLTSIGSKYSADEIADIIEHGTGNMQPQKQVSDDDRKILSEWLADKK